MWLARALAPQAAWLHALAPVLVIVGHNYSIWLVERGEGGRLRLRGGAGGSPCVGGSVGLWWPTLFILPPLGALILFGVGYASVATMSMGVLSTLIFGVRAYLGLSPWWYAAYGLLAEVLLLWALRPNIRRLRNGTERMVGWRARRRKPQSSSADPA